MFLARRTQQEQTVWEEISGKTPKTLLHFLILVKWIISLGENMFPLAGLPDPSVILPFPDEQIILVAEVAISWCYWATVETGHGPSEHLKQDLEIGHGPSEHLKPGLGTGHGPSEPLKTDLETSHGPSEHLKPGLETRHGPSEQLKPVFDGESSAEVVNGVFWEVFWTWLVVADVRQWPLTHLAHQRPN